MMQYSSIRVTEHFFDMLNKLIRRFATMKMEYFEGIDTQRSFPTIFRQLSDHFPTIFRQFSDEWIKIKKGNTGARSFILQDYILLLYHCATLIFLIRTMSGILNFFFTFFSTAFLRQNYVCLRHYCVFLFKQCVCLRQYCVILRQYSVHLRQYCVFLT